MRALLCPILLALLLGWPGVAAGQGLPPPAAGLPPVGLPIQWRDFTDYNAALDAAQRNGQLVFVYVYGPDCPWCEHFTRTHLSDPAFQLWANTLFQSIMVDESRPEARAWLRERRWPGEGQPRFYIVSGRGELVGRETGASRFPPMKALDVFTDLAGAPVPFPRERLMLLAQQIRAIRAPADQIGRTLVYAGMEALAWHWAGDKVRTRRAFGNKFERYLFERPLQPDAIPEAWDEIRIWYVKFWHDWVKDNFNYESAARVAESGATGDQPLYARYAALLYHKMGQPDKARRYAAIYDKTPYSRNDPDFRQIRNAALQRR